MLLKCACSDVSSCAYCIQICRRRANGKNPLETSLAVTMNALKWGGELKITLEPNAFHGRTFRRCKQKRTRAKKLKREHLKANKMIYQAFRLCARFHWMALCVRPIPTRQLVLPTELMVSEKVCAAQLKELSSWMARKNCDEHEQECCCEHRTWAREHTRRRNKCK